ncbi:MAG: NADH-quinone oxidoreductase subunit J [Fibrobacter sp.]|nr:NADH-quinone oxidoreductase subunit J [Fibrobacter sp.]
MTSFLTSISEGASILSATDIAFYVVAFFMIVTAFCTVAVRNILLSAVFLITSFVGTAIFYLLLNAEFNALAQIMVYIGGVVIFVIFTILLTSHLGEEAFSAKVPRLFAAFAISIAFVGIMLKCVIPITSSIIIAEDYLPHGYASLTSLAIRLLDISPNGFIIPFEIISLLLLATLVGAASVIRRKEKK